MTTTSPPIDGIFRNYLPPGGSYDEYSEQGRAPRPHVRPFVESINALGQKEFIRRWQQAQRLVHENGLAYSGNLGPTAQPRPWTLDALPLLISSTEWQFLSQAILQRVELLDLALKDIYGEQSLLKKGVLPPELVFSHPGLLHAFEKPRLPDGRMLHFYAADLVRSADGKWWVLADRTEAPSGLGYALENRVVISRMLPDIFRKCQVERLAPFFIAAHETLRNLAPAQRENPRVVLLSHGATSPNYFEDAYLARYLGYTLVEGGDLAVRNGRVLLKTLGGLLPVDVILRHQNSNDCDPLELGSDSTLGVAGLTQEVRDGRVSIANVLGSGLVESSAFMAFMPQLCQALLGEGLKIPGVATWWCGDEDGKNYVLSHLDDLIVQPAFRRRGSDGALRESLNTMSHKELTETICSQPADFSARQRVGRSTVPVWKEDLQSANVALRAYVVASGDSYYVMPGALARISSTLEPLEMSIRKGEGSKDVWVLADGPVEPVTLLDEPGRAIELRRSGTELPSRVADNFFWLGRHVERAEAHARVLRAAAGRMTGETRATSAVEIPILLRCMADQGQLDAGYAVQALHGTLPPIDRALPAALVDAANPGNLQAVLEEMFRLASIVRDRMSRDTWRIIYRIQESFDPARAGTSDLADLLALTDLLIIQLVAFSGIVNESMTRTQAFRFLELGRRIERAHQTISLLRSGLVPMPDAQGPILETILEVADSLMTYRSRYLANLQLAAVLDLLLTDETNPRSLAYQFVQIADHVQQLPRHEAHPGYTDEQRLAMSLLHSVQMIDIQELAEAHSLGDAAGLTRITDDWTAQLPRLFEAISHRYLVHASPSYQLTSINPQ